MCGPYASYWNAFLFALESVALPTVLRKELHYKDYAANYLIHVKISQRLCVLKTVVQWTAKILSLHLTNSLFDPEPKTIKPRNTEHVQGLGANGKAAFSPKAHG